MKCLKCKRENRVRANYCTGCGTAFDEKTKAEAYGKTVYGRIDRLLELKSWVTFEKITGHPVLRVVVLLLLLVAVGYNLFANGTSLSLKAGDGYALQCGENGNEYYVRTDMEVLPVSVYLPRKTESLTLQSYAGGQLIDTVLVNLEQGVTVQRNTNGYYRLTAVYDNGTEEELLFFVCGEDAK